MEVQACGYFDSVAPIRLAKPPLSDPSEGVAGCAVIAACCGSKELNRLRDLEAKPQVDAFFSFFPEFEFLMFD